MSERAKEISKVLEQVVVAECEFHPRKAKELAFHMTDWLPELDALAKLFADPEKFGSEDTYKILLEFLLHAPEHIAEAGYLMTGIRVEGIFDSESE